MRATQALHNKLPQIQKTIGLVVPPFTAYTAKGEINLELIPKQTEIIQQMGATAIFLGGTASEGASQTIEERLAIAEEYKKSLAKTNIRLMLHVGATSLKESQILAEGGQKIGVDAIASVTPTFFKPNNVGSMVEWMKELASSAPHTPFYYYHIPSMTGVPPSISVKQFMEKSSESIPSFHGVKYTSTNLGEYADLASVEGGKFDVMAGLAEQMLAALSMGAKAAVSAPFNNPFAMRYYNRILSDFNSGGMNSALKTQIEINKLTYLLQHGGHGGAAAVLRAMFKMETGVDLGPCRLPLKCISEENYRLVEKKIRDDLKLM